MCARVRHRYFATIESWQLSVGTSLVLNFSKGPGKYRAAFTTKRMSEQPVEIPFPWSIEQVEAIADEFFRKKSSNLREELRWSAAAREAVAHLLARRRACEKAVREKFALGRDFALIEGHPISHPWLLSRCVEHHRAEAVRNAH